MENAVKTLLSQIDAANLPVLPKVLVDLMAAIKQPNIEIAALVDIISQEPSLSSKIVMAANSSLYRQFGALTDLNRVVVILGLNTIKTIAITSAIHQFFSQLPQHHLHLLEIIWYRSLTCAHIAKRLATLTSYPYPEEAYLTGLLQRVGQLVLLASFPDDYPNYVKQLSSAVQQSTSGKELFRIPHPEVGGGWIATWGLHPVIADAVRYQYLPAVDVADSAALVKLINVASQLSSLDSANKYQIVLHVGQLLGLNQELVEDILQQVKPLVEQSAGELGLLISDTTGEVLKNLTTREQRQQVGLALGEAVKEFALLSAANQHVDSASEFGVVVSSIQQAIMILFGYESSAVFLHQEASGNLVGVAGKHQIDSLWPTLSLNLNTSNSLLVKAFNQKQVLYIDSNGQNEPEVLLDRQIGKLLGKAAMAIIPATLEGSVVAIVVIGFNQEDINTIKSKLKLIKLFTVEVAKVLKHLQLAVSAGQASILSLQESYRLHANKVRHEISNPLTIISNYLYLLGLRLGANGGHEVNVIMEEISRVGQIAAQLSDLPEKLATAETDSVDVNNLIRRLSELFQAGILKTKGIEIVLELQEALPLINISAGKLKQVLINLMKNAAEAMPQGGKITVSSKDRIYLGKTCYLQIEVADNGKGIPEDVLNHLFTPVASSKGQHNTGLGLAICKNLIDDMGGMISCSSSRDTGTKFQIFLVNEESR
ncbi:MAG: HDOD domain-containing protein [Methylococcaceae bacterium]|jgi:signal transduction histidine kinase/HD-like signal output (HDOD) protein